MVAMILLNVVYLAVVVMTTEESKANLGGHCLFTGRAVRAEVGSAWTSSEHTGCWSTTAPGLCKAQLPSALLPSRSPHTASVWMLDTLDNGQSVMCTTWLLGGKKGLYRTQLGECLNVGHPWQRPECHEYTWPLNKCFWQNVAVRVPPLTAARASWVPRDCWKKGLDRTQLGQCLNVGHPWQRPECHEYHVTVGKKALIERSSASVWMLDTLDSGQSVMSTTWLLKTSFDRTQLCDCFNVGHPWQRQSVMSTTSLLKNIFWQNSALRLFQCRTPLTAARAPWVPRVC